jgi:hypothetical protein
MCTVPCLLANVGSYVSNSRPIVTLYELFPLVFRDQQIDIHGQLDLARHFGPLHKHATTPIPRNGLEEVHGQIYLQHPSKDAHCIWQLCTAMRRVAPIRRHSLNLSSGTQTCVAPQ